jgi:hypothetical protein
MDVQMLALVAGPAIGVLGALAGVVLQQRLEERRAREAATLDSERQHAEWVRGRREKAHLAFLSEASRLQHFIGMYTRVGGTGFTPDDPVEGWTRDYPSQLPDDWWRPLLARMPAIEIYGSPGSISSANAVVDRVREAETGTVGALMAMDEALEEHRQRVRTDLGLAGTEVAAPKP